MSHLFFFFFFNDTATTEIYTLSLHDALPILSPDGKEIAFAMHGDSTVADNTSVDIYLASPDGSGLRALTTGRGADNTPRYSPDGRYLAYLSMERPGFEADRVRLMLVGRKEGRIEGGNVRSEEHTSELQSQSNLVCRLLLEKKKKKNIKNRNKVIYV